jgi:TPP-dependent 2-oxoacid decarboxylase
MTGTIDSETTIAGYLCQRLAEAGVTSVFGVPGDYNLGLLDAIIDQPDLHWVGTATEQGAGYAADGYARIHGLGAALTTFGVGELSAINAMAGAFAESVPVVHIVGTPALSARTVTTAGTQLHHNVPGTDFGHFARMAAEITAAQADLRPETAAAEIDRVLHVALRTRRPVYLALPADVAQEAVPAPRGPLRVPQIENDATPMVLQAFADHAGRLLRRAESASVLLGQLASRHGALCEVRELVDAAGIPVAVLSTAKGDFPESDPHFAGLYAGAASADDVRPVVEDVDVLIAVGAQLSDTLIPGGAQLPSAGRIDLTPGSAAVDGVCYPGVGLADALTALTKAVQDAQFAPRPKATVVKRAAATAGHLTQDDMWAAMQDFLEPGDLILADQGSAFYGAARLTMPPDAQLLGQPMWASIGWTLPAALGAALAAPDRRIVLLIGDGALQQTVAELGVMFSLGLAPVIIVLNNSGYTVERIVHRPEAPYHDIPAWNLTSLSTAFGAMSPLSLRAATVQEFGHALEAIRAGSGRPVLIEAVLGLDDAPPLLRDLARALRESSLTINAR